MGGGGLLNLDVGKGSHGGGVSYERWNNVPSILPCPFSVTSIALSAPVADSFVRQSREGLSAGETVKSALTSVLILLAMSPLLFLLANVGMKADYEFNKRVVKDAIAESKNEQKQQMLPKPQRKLVFATVKH